MRSVLQLFSLSLVSSLSMGAAASAAVVAGGFNWDYGYTGDGDVLPSVSTPGFISSGSGSAVVSGGIITIDTTATDGRSFALAQADGGAWNPAAAGDVYVEFRAKVNSIVPGTRFAGGFNFWSHGDRVDYQLGTFSGKTGLFNGSSANVVELDVTQWHTYRTSYSNNSNTYNLWIDGVQVLTNSTITLSAPSNQIRFGDFSGDHRGSISIDYLVWNNQGAPTPVPEPASLSLLALSSIALLRRRRA